MNNGTGTDTAVTTLLSSSSQFNSLAATAAAAAATAVASATSTSINATSEAIRDQIAQEALELYNLQTQTNSSLLDYGLNLGFIERRSSDGRLTIDSLNAFPMSSSQLVEQLLTELVLRLGIFIPATSLIKIAIDSNSDDPDREDTLRCVYILSIILHQIVNYDETSVRTLNRVLMCLAIILFSLTTTNSKPCKDMDNFKQKIRKRLLVDYYLWSLTFTMSLVLTCGSPLYINLEYAHGVEMHIMQLVLTAFCVIHLSFSMRIIGYGRLAPLIAGTPLIFLDTGDGITLAKGSALFICYFFFWCSDWRELVDWNHSMLCEAGICKLLNKESGKLRAKVKKAKHKFDEWRLEEGLDDDGWFILLDAPANLANGTTFRPHTNESSSATNNQNEELAQSDDDDDNQPTENADETVDANEEVSERLEDEQENLSEDGNEDVDEEQIIDYSERVIYLQSRNPLLTSLAALMLVVWK